jgi:hypothetical protein
MRTQWTSFHKVVLTVATDCTSATALQIAFAGELKPTLLIGHECGTVTDEFSAKMT